MRNNTAILWAVICGGVTMVSESEYFTRLAFARMQLGLNGQYLLTYIAPLLIGLIVILMLWPWSAQITMRLRYRYIVVIFAIMPLSGIVINHLGHNGITSVHISRAQFDPEDIRRFLKKSNFPVVMQVSSHATTILCRNQDALPLKVLIQPENLQHRDRTMGEPRSD